MQAVIRALLCSKFGDEFTDVITSTYRSKLLLLNSFLQCCYDMPQKFSSRYYPLQQPIGLSLSEYLIQNRKGRIGVIMIFEIIDQAISDLLIEFDQGTGQENIEQLSIHISICSGQTEQLYGHFIAWEVSQIVVVAVDVQYLLQIGGFDTHCLL